jgi:Leucine-rich repeat (LRR) protein
VSKRRPRQSKKEEKALAEASALIEASRKKLATHLNLSGLRLNELPESVGMLTELQVLFVSHNNLRTLPRSICDLKHLTDLYIDGNELTALPEHITRLKQLRHLDCSSNKLTTLPESIGEMVGLESLFLDDNNLAELPESLRKLTWLIHLLRDVDLEGAPFAGLQFLPGGGKAVTLWEDKDTAWRSVAVGIKKVAERVRKRLGHTAGE